MTPPAYIDDYVDGVIYARYSSHAQRDVSIEQQIRACRIFAERHGIRILEIYEDRALTGTSDKRPGFQRMIQDAKKGAWQYVIVYTLDRFARDRYDSAVYKRQLKNCGVKVLSAMENISDDPTGVLMESMLEGLAEYYSKELSRKVQRGMDDNASKCMVNGAVPLGYKRGDDGRYEIVPAEAEIVREIYQRVHDGEQLRQIIDDLNNRGIKTKKGKEWNRSSFNLLLCNERYTGLYKYRDVRVPGGIPTIIPKQLFDEVQGIMYHKPNCRRDPTGNTPQKRRREGGTYLLTGKIYCGNCKSAMTGISGKSQSAEPYYYYACKGRRADHAACDKKNVRRDHIERFVATALKDTMLTDEAIYALADAAAEFQKNDAVSHEVESLKNQLADINRSIKNLLAAIEAGIFSGTTQSRLLELENQQRDLTQMLAAAQAALADRMTRDEMIALLKVMQEGDVNDKTYQEALIDTFLVAAYVYEDKVKFVFNLGNKTKNQSIPFDIESVDFDASVCISDVKGDQESGDCISSCRIFYLYRSCSVRAVAVIINRNLLTAYRRHLCCSGRLYRCNK